MSQGISCIAKTLLGELQFLALGEKMPWITTCEYRLINLSLCSEILCYQFTFEEKPVSWGVYASLNDEEIELGFFGNPDQVEEKIKVILLSQHESLEFKDFKSSIDDIPEFEKFAGELRKKHGDDYRKICEEERVFADLIFAKCDRENWGLGDL